MQLSPSVAAELQYLIEELERRNPFNHWSPQPGPQQVALNHEADELFIGGSRGGGKSDFLVGDQLHHALTHEGKSAGIMIRQNYPELEELQRRCAEVFSPAGAIYQKTPNSRKNFSNCWYFPNGATVKMRFLENEDDYSSYHGHSYSRISVDEAGQYPAPYPITKMMSTLRNAHGVPCRIRAAANPGGIGTAWIKARYIDPAPSGQVWYPDPSSSFTRVWLRSVTDDNEILMRNDPMYKQRIQAATHGNDALSRAWLDGDWYVVAGAFFPMLDPTRHITTPFNIPDHWMRFRAADWGSARPFAVGWFAVASEDTHLPSGVVLPRGGLYLYREWYGLALDRFGNVVPNTGLYRTAEEVAEGILQREKDDNIAYGVMDPATFANHGGPSIAERMARVGVRFRPADNTRVSKRGAMGGWDALRQRLVGEETQRPMLVFSTECTHIYASLAGLQHDTDNIEDCDSTGDDHGADCVRYGAMSRPWTRPAPHTSQPDGIMISDLLSRNKDGRRQPRVG